jgi:hemerythrin-like metal-binding protein
VTIDSKIEIFPWNENFATGIPEIDIQHRRLIQLLNVLVAHLAYQREAPAINQIMVELKDYAAVHFATEEEIWHSYFGDDSWEEWHKGAHGDFVAQIEQLIGDTDGKSYDEMVEGIVRFLTHWLALHIIESDKRMAKVVLAMPTGVSLERAKELANREMSGATRVLIETVMGMYDNLAHRTILLTREINARIRSEEALRAAQADLMRLKDLAEESERRSVREIKNFAYVLSHHVQEPVREQMLYTSRLKQALERKGDLDEATGEALGHIVKGGERLRGLLGDMHRHLALSHSPWTPKRVATAGILDRALNRLGGRIREAGATIERGELPVAMVDKDRLADVLTALIDNSLTFRRPDLAPRIRVGCEMRSDQLEFQVEDNGIGIAADMRQRVFGVFERLHPHHVFPGTGIGLAVVQKIVESAGGRVWIDGAASGGTIVHFTLPA